MRHIFSLGTDVTANGDTDRVFQGNLVASLQARGVNIKDSLLSRYGSAGPKIDFDGVEVTQTRALLLDVETDKSSIEEAIGIREAVLGLYRDESRNPNSGYAGQFDRFTVPLEGNKIGIPLVNNDQYVEMIERGRGRPITKGNSYPI